MPDPTLEPDATDGVHPHWVTAFVDVPEGQWEASRRFRSAVTGWTCSPPRGDRDEFVSYLPPDGTDLLRGQRLAAGPARVHLDLHVGDRVEAARRHAVALGATDLPGGDGHRVLRSPGGFVWCLVPGTGGTGGTGTTGADGARVPVGAVHGAGHRSRLAQVCLDVPAAAFDGEVRFWAALLGVQPLAFPAVADAVALPPPAGSTSATSPTWPLRVILQRLGDGDRGGPDGTGGGVRGHLEWWTEDVAAEVDRHRAAGAVPVSPGTYWEVLADPAGLPYCVIGRDPVTGEDL